MSAPDAAEPTYGSQVLGTLTGIDAAEVQKGLEGALEAAGIVEDLAATEPLDSARYCTLCSHVTGEHDDSCPWLRAQKMKGHADG